MALRLSTALRNALLSRNADVPAIVVGIDISFNTSSGTNNIATTSTNISGFTAGRKIEIKGTSSNDGQFTVLTAAAAKVTVEETVTPESAGNAVAIAETFGGCFADLFNRGVLRIYTGSQPTTPQTAESGTCILVVTDASGAFTADSGVNGLLFASSASAGTLAKSGSQTWSGVGIGGGGTAGWFRLYDKGYNTGADASGNYIRMDGAISTSGAQLNMASTTITSAATTTIDSFDVTMPAS
jgi:hypothetical protein